MKTQTTTTSKNLVYAMLTAHARTQRDVRSAKSLVINAKSFDARVAAQLAYAKGLARLASLDVELGWK